MPSHDFKPQYLSDWYSHGMTAIGSMSRYDPAAVSAKPAHHVSSALPTPPSTGHSPIQSLSNHLHLLPSTTTNDLLSPILIILVFELLKIIIIIAQSTTTTHIVEDPPITKSQNSIVVLQSAPHQVFSLIIISVCFRIKWLPLFNANEYNKKLCHFLNRHFWSRLLSFNSYCSRVSCKWTSQRAQTYH